MSFLCKGMSNDKVYLFCVFCFKKLLQYLNFSCNSVQVQKVLFSAVISVYNWKGLTRKLIKSFLKRGFTVNKFYLIGQNLFVFLENGY